MKRFPTLLLAAGALAFAGCADELEKPIGQEAGEKFGRGISGGGQLGPVERAENDPAANHGVPQTHP